MSAARQKQQKKELLQEQSNSRPEAEAKAKAIATEVYKQIEEGIIDLQRQCPIQFEDGGQEQSQRNPQTTPTPTPTAREPKPIQAIISTTTKD